jgi:hypothetical protein
MALYRIFLILGMLHFYVFMTSLCPEDIKIGLNLGLKRHKFMFLCIYVRGLDKIICREINGYIGGYMARYTYVGIK